ncbi:MAG: sigma-70 family RNA polymerase sigma factor [Butyricicoccus sp.]|nr:sigma-70 family RNA polymerase sigma factor [Butyricicoccus sp.]
MNEKEFAVRAERLRARLYRCALMYMGNEHDALDALDEAVYKALRACRRLRQEEFFDTWMTRIVINQCRSQLRRRRNEVSLEELDEAAAERFDALPLREAVRALPRELRDVVVLRYFSGYTLRETAEILEIPPGTAATRQRRALEALRLELEDKEV